MATETRSKNSILAKVDGQLATLVETVPGDSLDVSVNDQTTPIVDVYFFNPEGTVSLSAPVAVDDTSFTVPDGSVFSTGDVVCFQEGSHIMQALVLSVDGNTINIDTPFDFAFTTSGGCAYGSRNMAVDGSTEPVVFQIGPGNLADGQEWDIVRVLFSITDQESMDDGKFGGAPALPKGFVLRAMDGITNNIFNIKTNGEFALRNFDATYVSDTLGPSGLYGFRSRRTFGGQSKNGVVIRLKATDNDALQIIIQDDLTGLETFYAVAQGHFTD